MWFSLNAAHACRSHVNSANMPHAGLQGDLLAAAHCVPTLLSCSHISKLGPVTNALSPAENEPVAGQSNGLSMCTLLTSRAQTR